MGEGLALHAAEAEPEGDGESAGVGEAARLKGSFKGARRGAAAGQI